MKTQTHRSQVAVVACATYDPDAVYQALRKGVDLLGGLDRFIRPGERILLKPNVLAGDQPEAAVTTHPSVLAGCVRLVKKGGAAATFGDSPAAQDPVRAIEQCGLLEAGGQHGAELADFSTVRRLDQPGGDPVSSFPIAQAVLESDGIINLPKMKGHSLTRITGAVKNLYGCIPGRWKALYHVRFPDVMAFSGLLTALAGRLRPRLHVLDGVVAMEGNGPRGGDPTEVGVLLLSDDPVAIDATFSRIIRLDPSFVPTTTLGHERGLGVYEESDIEIMGESLEAFFKPAFRIIRKPVQRNAQLAHFNLIKRLLLPRPVIDQDACVRCGVCVEACPVPGKALRFADDPDRPPVYDYDVCIRCYCCHEACPHRAISQWTPLLGRIFGGII